MMSVRDLVIRFASSARSKLLCSAAILAFGLIGCSKPNSEPSAGAGAEPKPNAGRSDSVRKATADLKDVEAAKALIDGIGADARYRIVPDNVLVEIVIKDGSGLKPDDIALFGKLSDLESLEIFNYRQLDDETAAHLSGLKKLERLALTNSTIGDPTVDMIVESFPSLKVLDLSSNTNMSNRAMKVICKLSELERLVLVQNRFNDLGTLHLANLKKLKFLDLRGNMEAGDMTLSIVGALPALQAFKHRSTTVTDSGIEELSKSKTLRALLMQDFNITSEAGQHLAALSALRELEIFRCPGFGSEGVAALGGMPLTRLQLRDLPMVDDQAMAVFENLPQLKRLYLHENDSITDDGLQSLAKLKELEVIDLWALPQVGDETINVLATLPKLRELSVRTVGITDAAVETILGMKQLQTLVFKENGSVSQEAIEKLRSRNWKRLDLGD